MTPRQCAFNLLLDFKRKATFSNIALNNALRKNEFSQSDKSYITALFYGVIEKQITIDYQLCVHLRQPLKKLKPEVLVALRMGVYQILFMDKVPDSAAVNESVKLVKKNKSAFAASLVNATLRNVSADGLILPEKNIENYLSVKYSVSLDIINLWNESYGEETALNILKSFGSKTKTAIRVNTLKINKSDLQKMLEDEEIICEDNKLCENSLLISKSGNLLNNDCFNKGYFHIEDTAAQLAALALEVHEGDRVLDVCAAPGGKTFTVAEIMRSGEIIACDIYEQRLKLIKQGAKRLGIDFIKTVLLNGTEYNGNLGLFDKILCDVPCSGLGTISSKPEIRYKTKEQLDYFPSVQYKILDNAFNYLKPGGTIVYSTCTLNKNENENVINKFKTSHICELISEKTYFPHIDNTDGFFVAVIRKNG